jgi:probable HAF family extracellular repeat protein
MLMRSLALHCSITMMAFAALAVPIQPVAQVQNYSVTTLGTLGGTSSAAISITDSGLVSGYSNLPGNQTQVAVRFQNRRPISLGTLGGPNSGVAWPNHNPRAIVGIAETAAIDRLAEAWSCSFFFPSMTGHVCLGFVWQGGIMNPLPTLGGINGYAAGANAPGQVVGWAETPVQDPTCLPPQILQFEAVVWGPGRGQIQQLTPIYDDPDSAATAINNQGQVVGISGICENAVGDKSATHAVLWEKGAVIDLGSLGGDAWNTPAAINDQGQVAGFSENAQSNIHAFLWTRQNGIEDLGTLDGDNDSYAYGINERGQVVGQSIGGPYGSRAFIWQNGVMTDLNCLTPVGSPYLLYANDIDDSGRITGEAYDPSTGEAPAFLAAPLPGINHCPGNSKAAQIKSDHLPASVIFPKALAGIAPRSGVSTRLPPSPR